MLKSKHNIEVFEGRNGFYWRARFIGKGPMENKIIAGGEEPYSTRSNARRAARRMARVLAFAPVVDIQKNLRKA